jgi:hypothetical protein
MHRDLTPSLREMAAAVHKKVVDRHLVMINLKNELAQTRREIVALREGEPIWPIALVLVAATTAGAAIPHVVRLLFGP